MKLTPYFLFLALSITTTLLAQTKLQVVKNGEMYLADEPSIRTTDKSIFVDAKKGNDANKGTFKKPFKTINKALEFAMPGDTVKVMPGKYVEYKDYYSGVRFVKSGTPDKYITLWGVVKNGKRPIVTSAALICITPGNESYVSVENFEMLPLEGNSANLKLEDFYGQRGTQITAKNHHVIFRNNYVYDFGGNGLTGAYCNYVWFDRNVIEHCGYKSKSGNSGISIYEPQVAATETLSPFKQYPNYGIIITNNIVRYNVNLRGFAVNGTKMTDGQGICLDDWKAEQSKGKFKPYSGRGLVQGNWCYGNGANGINVFLSVNVDVFDNVCYDNAHTHRIANPAYEVLLKAAQLTVVNSDNVHLKRNIMVSSNDFLPLDIWKTTNLVQENNMHWNGNSDLNTFVETTDKVANPLFVSATPLTQKQINLFGTMTNPFDINSISATVRLLTKKNSFPIQNLNLQVAK